MSRRRGLAISLVISALAALALASSANAALGISAFEVTYTDAEGLPATQAGSHPAAITTELEFTPRPGEKPGELLYDGSPKDLTVALPTGLVGDRAAVPYCSTADFLRVVLGVSQCPDDTAVGVLSVGGEPGERAGDRGPAFNLTPPPGTAARIGFILVGVPVVLLIRVNPNPPYNLVASLQNTSDAVPFGGSTLTIWGNPASPAHDAERGDCARTGGLCPADSVEKPFLTLPRACTGPLFTTYSLSSWEEPLGTPLTGSSASALTTNGCGRLPFGPTITAKPTTIAAQSPTGLDFSLDVDDQQLQQVDGTAASDVRKAVVTLPAGMTVNPSIAEGLEVCTKARLAKETAFSAPGEGCPNASKIGTVEVETPLLDENVDGALYQAPQDDPTTPEPGAENPFDNLVTLFMVIKNPQLGIVVKQALKVEPDPLTGRLTTVADDIPQLPFSHFRLHFREGARSPLASPPGCGTYAAEAKLYPWSGNAPVTTTSAFEIVTGSGGGVCPGGGVPPLKPRLQAGTLSNSAGRYSPFYLRLSRSDGEQELTHFSIKLPPGLTGKLAGIPFCPDAAIEAAKTRTATAELASPSCPKASEVGRTLVGAGVGPSLAYAPGKVYLAGPYHGSALSVAAITAAKVGPFELGTVVVREALKVNPETAEVFIDATGSDPIPHILKGIPVHARDIRVYVERPDFTLNPTSCKPTSTASTVLGSGLDFGSEADDQPFTVTSPFQAAECKGLGFAPKLSLSLTGGTKRSQNPALKAVLRARPGDANIARAQVTLPGSEFLDQSHIRTICTRVQFAEGSYPGEKCPPASVYGYAKAITPLLDEPVQGPVFLRSNGGERQLPDLVAALHSGRIDVNLVGYIDQGAKNGIRNTFALVPDAPVKTFTLTMQGGRKGLLVNSVDICRRPQRALADFTGQNGKRKVLRPVLGVGCKGGK